MFIYRRQSYQQHIQRIHIKHIAPQDSCIVEIWSQQKEEDKNSIVKEFQMIFILLQLVGIDVLDYFKDKDSHPSKGNETHLAKSKIISCVKKCSKCFFFVVLFFKCVAYTLQLFLVSLRAWEYFAILATAIVLSIYASVYLRPQAIIHMIENLNQIHQKLSGRKPRCDKYYFILYFIFSQILITIWGLMHYYKEESITPQDIKPKSTILSYYLEPQLFLTLFQHIQALYYFSAVFIMSVLAVFYSFTCKCIRDLTQCLLEQVNKNYFSEEIETLISLHVDIIRCIRYMDSNFSYFAFVTVFMSMIGTFWGGYKLAFCETLTTEYFFSKFCLMLFNFSIQLLIMLSASFTNELTEEATKQIQCLLCRVPSDKREMKCNLKKDLTRPNTLTLWKIYVMDRSLIISSFATLLTYGILLGSLGGNQ
ncbi:uncharacterized protein TNCT_475471 [Trichonephila clavata]|uniref:Gustatory receptor n=1 Tax=Trichonephila clavata TaxID=2740835 RepID=A0A8X6LQ99_TRICU|nr:uncharacterized protein TNCT_475471 [Trichonephila clavata]